MQGCLSRRSGDSQNVLDGCMEVIVLLTLVACLLAGCLLNEGAREPSSEQGKTPARYDEGTHATNRNAATGERGYHNKCYRLTVAPTRR